MAKRLDLTGKQFDELTVIEMLWNYQNKHRTYCRCIGIDGNEYIIRQDALTSGVTHTIHGACSGGIPEDITGKRFGRLVALEPSDQRASNGGICWKCICDCGQIIYPAIHNLKRGHTTSCGCAKSDYIESCKLDIIGKRFGKLVVVKELPQISGERRKVECVCDCGNTHICSVMDLTCERTTSCGCDRRSKGEKYIEQILMDLEISYVRQKRFDDCRNIKPLPFDFYLPNYTTCIEYDGEQHFQPVEFWGGEDRFSERQNNDRIKTEYCKNHNIHLIRFSYKTSKEDMNETISQLMSPATITA